MKYSEDYREIARNALKGKWPVAILTGYLAGWMGAGFSNFGSASSSSRRNESNNQWIQELVPAEIMPQVTKAVLIIIVFVLIWLLVCVVISGAAKFGYAIFNLKLIDGEDAQVGDLFSQFHRLGDGFGMNFGIGLYTFLWSLLFVVPGVIKSYSYSMTPFIMAENPNLKVDDAITESRRIMDGNKFRLFCLNFSFIGWELLCSAPVLVSRLMIYNRIVMGASLMMVLWIIPCSIPSFIGNLFLKPYKEATMTAFYRDISFIKKADTIAEDTNF